MIGIKMRLVFLFLVFLLSGCCCDCMQQIECTKFSKASSFDVYFGIFVDDDSLKLQEALKGGLPLNNCYVASGNVSPEFCKQRGETLFMLACVANATNCLHILEKSGINLMARSLKGQSVLHFLYGLNVNESIRIAEHVLMTDEIGVDDLDYAGRTPLWWALKKGNLDYAEWLRERGADFNRVRMKLYSYEPREVPYAFDAVRFNFDAFTYCMNQKDFLPGNSPWNEMMLHVSPFSERYDERIFMLVAKGANINFYKDGRSVVINIAKYSHHVPVTIERLEKYVRLGLNKNSLLLALDYAKKHNCKCVKVIDEVLSDFKD